MLESPNPPLGCVFLVIDSELVHISPQFNRGWKAPRFDTSSPISRAWDEVHNHPQGG